MKVCCLKCLMQRSISASQAEVKLEAEIETCFFGRGSPARLRARRIYSDGRNLWNPPPAADQEGIGCAGRESTNTIDMVYLEADSSGY
jgi:hypothetical protein